MFCATKTPSNFHNVTGTNVGARVTEGCASQGIAGVAGAVGHLREWPVMGPFRMGYLALSGELLKKLQLEQSECKKTLKGQIYQNGTTSSPGCGSGVVEI